LGAPANGSWVSTRGVVTQRGLVVSHQVAAFARVRGLVCDGGRGWAFAACRPARDFRHRNTCALPAPSPLSPHCSGGKVGPFHGDKVGNPARRFCNVGAAGRTCAKSRPPTITGGREQGHTQLLLMTRMRLKMARACCPAREFRHRNTSALLAPPLSALPGHRCGRCANRVCPAKGASGRGRCKITCKRVY